MVCWLRGVHTAIENPLTSLFAQVEPAKTILQWIIGGSLGMKTFLGSFGAPSPKPILLWGSWKGLWALKRSAPTTDQCPIRLATLKDDGSVQGNKRELEESSAYPNEFSKTMALRLDMVFGGQAKDCFETEHCIWSSSRRVIEEKILPNVERKYIDAAWRLLLTWEDFQARKASGREDGGAFSKAPIVTPSC